MSKYDMFAGVNVNHQIPSEYVAPICFAVGRAIQMMLGDPCEQTQPWRLLEIWIEFEKAAPQVIDVNISYRVEIDHKEEYLSAKVRATSMGIFFLEGPQLVQKELQPSVV